MNIEERYQMFMNNTPFGIIFVRKDGKIIDINPYVVKMFGHKSKESLMKMNLFDNKNMKESGIHKHFKRCLETGESVIYEHEYTATNGKRFFLSYNMSPMLDSNNELIGAFSFIQDITEKKLSEQRLRENEQKYRLIADNSHDTITLIQGKNIVYMTPSCKNITQRSEEEFIGKTIEEFFQFIHPDDRERIKSSIEQAAINRTTEFRYTYRLKRKDGSYAWVEDTIRGEYNENGIITQSIINTRDITERKIIEEQLRRSEEKYKSLSDLSPYGITLTDLDGNITYISKKTHEIFGLESEKDAIGTNILEWIIPSQHHIAKAKVNEIITQKIFAQYEYVCLRKDGSTFDADIGASTLTDSEGKVIGLISVTRDITESKQAASEIKKFKTVFDNANFGMAIANIEGKIIYINKYFAECHGYKTEEVVDKTLSLFHNDEQYEIFKKFSTELQKKGSYNAIEIWHTRKDNTVFPMLMNGVVIYDEDNQPAYIAETAIDITDYKRLMTELEETELRYRILVETTEDMISLLDVHTLNFLYVNPSAINKTGYTLDEFKELSLFKILKQEHHTLIKEKAKQRYLGNKEVTYLESEVITKDNKHIAVEITSSIIYKDNKPSYLLVNCHDIRERKKTENELLKAKDRAEEANKLKTQFLANMSHELRTPLTAIIGFSDIFVRSNLKREQIIESSKVIYNSGIHLLKLIDEILQLSEIETGKSTIEKTAFNIDNLIQSTLTLTENQFEEKNLMFIKEIKDDVPPEIHTDETKLKQILINLLTNATKFTDEGSITLRVKHFSDTHLLFSLGDTGIGIPEQKKELIFEPFEQVNRTLSKNVGGTGLGLAITKKLVELLGGTIWVDSKINEGSTFYFTIECLKREVDKSKIKKHTKYSFIEPRSVITKKRILLVEDTEENIALVKAYFSTMNINRYSVAKTGEEALMLSKEDIDLILMDIQLPGIDGLEVTRRLRRFGNRCRNIPIIAMTAYVTNEDEKRCLDAGCDDFIKKPVTRDQLLEKLHKHLQPEDVKDINKQF